MSLSLFLRLIALTGLFLIAMGVSSPGLAFFLAVVVILDAVNAILEAVAERLRAKSKELSEAQYNTLLRDLEDLKGKVNILNMKSGLTPRK